ncbi:hypothetical protein DM44_1618 [Burkholderia cepacia]|jgi:hypothetical protein|nr:hypothetical protein DM42_1771 [Burkholderia cepacia]KGB95938.1 hypothetical protein DM44_1618 [Burkholderia cepacia]
MSEPVTRHNAPLIAVHQTENPMQITAAEAHCKYIQSLWYPDWTGGIVQSGALGC